MKEKKIILLTAIFFLLVNTSYFWNSNLELLALPAILVIFFFYLALVIIFFQQLFLLINLKFRNRKKLLVATGLLLVLILTTVKPRGFIDFDSLAGKDLLIAEVEGAANCMTVLKLKDNHTFIQRDVCFGTSETNGSYEIKGDTILFKDVSTSRLVEHYYYPYAIVRQTANNYNKKYIGELICYKSNTDHVGRPLAITKNELKIGF